MIQQINEALEHVLDDVCDGRVKEAMLYSLLAGGKRVRPLLFMNTLKGYNIPCADYLNIGLAIECVHTYSLIHDDLPAMDNDDYRRGNLTCHKKFDEATAILAGDALLTEAFHLILNSKANDAQKVKLVDLLSLASGVRGMVKGQELDMYEAKESTLEDMDQLKTGCLLSIPMMMAAIVSGHDEDVANFEKIGKTFGIIFQIQDDILDVTSTQEELGKPVMSDEKNDKTNYVSLYGIDKCNELINEYYLRINEPRNLFTNDFNDLFNYLESLNKRKK